MTQHPESAALTGNGRVLWLTGLSGTGKSTLARILDARLRDDGALPVLLDGDELRAAIGDGTAGYDRDGRRRNAWRIARLAALFGNQGHLVIVATMSLFHEIHAWNRFHQPGYLEILLEADLATLAGRDPKGLYRRHAAGDERHVGGLDLAVELPEKPDLRLVTDSGASPADLAERVLAALGRG
ncbi:adenylyl-sulfate kinase [Oceanibacterium hippocampi]|uniref:Putative adenylyl-sulfate kinase n=1 Tax=Oceanibacterium hippocampi TaxID=745714 RepID=A0A1Y5SFN2_9PROT|nr:adenylyl-sulfate kinase [Oceanibacterium hippocampi]SLN38502.1 putative adenylyl-sulfate kinase [Oceanibacterium hippocampi]